MSVRLRATFADRAALVTAHSYMRERRVDVLETYAPVPIEFDDEEVSPVRRWVLLGGIAGLLSGFALTVGTALYWPLITSGMPIVSLPPFLIIAFETTILLAALVGLAGFLTNAKLPSFAAGPGYDERFAAADFGLVLSCEEDRTDQIDELLVGAGATEVEQLDEPDPEDGNRSGTIMMLGLVVLAAAAAGCGIEMPNDMHETAAVHADEELRLPAAGTLHRDGEVPLDRFEAAVFSFPPERPDAASVERGELLFAIYCTPCHGMDGKGGGVVAEHFGDRPPIDLTDVRARNQTDGYIYATIRNGGGNMSSMGAAIDPNERWAIVSYIRALQAQRP